MSQNKSKTQTHRTVGSKGAAGVAQTLINLMPRHTIYIEAFLGKGVIFKLKKRAALSALIDTDERALDAIRPYIDATVSTHNADARDVILKNQYRWMSDRSTLVYCDPPYLEEVRSSKRNYYRHEFKTQIEHESLLLLLLSLKCNVMISGYRCDLYDDLLAKWHRYDYQTMTHGGVKTESVWCNFARPLELHDYSYLGSNFRERERIKRQQVTTRKRLARLSQIERYAMLSVIDEQRAQWESEQ